MVVPPLLYRIRRFGLYQ